MMESLQNDLSNRIFTMKTGLGNLIELVESWVIALGHEQERLKHLQAIERIIDKSLLNLKAEEYKSCKDHLSALIGKDDSASYSSSAFRQKLQKLFQDQISQLNQEMDHFFKQTSKILESLKKDPEPTGGLIMAQEDERKRISREIHDGPAQSLANLTMRIDFCSEHLQEPEMLKKELNDLKESIIRSLKDIRRFIFDLRPMALDDLGLIPTLEQFLSGFKARTGRSVSLHVDGERVSLEPEKDLAIFRVIQEAVNNANRHSQSKSIQVFLSYDAKGHQLNGVIKDDGTGFDVENIRKSYSKLKKLGLLSMEERIKLAEGRFSLISNPGEGTVVSFTIPI